MANALQRPLVIGAIVEQEAKSAITDRDLAHPLDYQFATLAMIVACQDALKPLRFASIIEDY